MASRDARKLDGAVVIATALGRRLRSPADRVPPAVPGSRRHDGRSSMPRELDEGLVVRVVIELDERPAK